MKSEKFTMHFPPIVSRSGKRHDGFVSNHESLKDAVLWLQQNKADNEFAMSLVDAFLEATANRKTLSDTRVWWTHRLATPEPTPEKVELDASGIVALMDKAAKNLKAPKFVVSNVGRTVEIKVAMAGPRSKFAGRITVAAPVFGKGFFGTIADGEFKPTRSCTAAHRKLLADFAADPEGMAAAHGHRTGQCCFCNKELTTVESTAVGFGPTCAKNFGLKWGKKAAEEALAS